ncbi:hypothetical protein A2625_00195 [candidate division WOR-1 bacterium RIFCSPHIGHO2_01_FULL_53_15]|uniref:Uncharacterized protein n=1 Tax=candidate division WOR-1 bacterium RIFCSPHIGHO2_01_FULL_53_15 TaxID=1802564 RepID=A0A1F4Q3Y4_UNCSA|nr:MAG: hypothetical protein A2625_00195 [candidate division WOR-1 bacterium RIFCSPHIGHO2_01_FULL_53_15]OGC13394.1 MAG: hypothetical protein A3D23_04495 [candidate division WOR-1 bacterium RIFCSPHIGHO2_02_FULL_53_26]
MAETLGSIIDKLIIKRIRLHHLEQMRRSPKISRATRLINEQIVNYTAEVEDFLKKAVKGKVVIREPKVKLYRNPPSKLALKQIRQLGQLIDILSATNIRLWDFEDQVRVKGTSCKRVAQLKHNIDLSNKERNNAIDRIDELLEAKIKQCRV